MNISAYVADITSFAPGSATGLLGSTASSFITKYASSRLLSIFPSVSPKWQRGISSSLAFVVSQKVASYAGNATLFHQGVAFGALINTGLVGYIWGRDEAFEGVESASPGMTSNANFKINYDKAIKKYGLDAMSAMALALLRNDIYKPFYQLLGLALGFTCATVSVYSSTCGIEVENANQIIQ